MKKKRVLKKKSKKSQKNLKEGGFLPLLLPLLGPLIGGLGGLAAGSAGIASAVNKAKADAKVLEELKRHNKQIEGRGIRKNKKKRAKGLFLKPRRS